MRFVKPDVDAQLEWSERFDYESEALTRIPEGKGVYLLLRLLPNRRWRLFYVGQGEVRAFLVGHSQPTEANECIRDHLRKNKCRFQYSFVEDDERRRGIARFLIRTYDALGECNDVLPDAEPVSVNLPD
jgi:hypothetical protein